jgi:hypothetical protein
VKTHIEILVLLAFHTENPACNLTSIFSDIKSFLECTVTSELKAKERIENEVFPKKKKKRDSSRRRQLKNQNSLFFLVI